MIGAWGRQRQNQDMEKSLAGACFEAGKMVEGRQIKCGRKNTWERGAWVMGVSKKPVEAELLSVCKYLSIQIDE